MRVIAGEYRGRKLERIEGMDIRPTADKVKGSIFNMLGNAVIDCSFLDLFGGTGGVGIEALSRGARHVLFIDAGIKSIKVLKDNLEHLNIKENVEVYHTDYETAIKKLNKFNKQFDIIFIDPPYRNGMAQNALVNIDRNPILTQSGIIIVEHDSKEDMPQKVGSLVKYRVKQYSNTSLSFYSIDRETEHKEE
ncbi:MAG TPA: 16S rRNA (guanine(966)-N(2))-methyltransferase RsmD [Negativicutes bacterium]|nr:16S rRNA (guanine(966)-N(2))-methyltransferase RsmD [Negativicutes bacterium]